MLAVNAWGEYIVIPRHPALYTVKLDEIFRIINNFFFLDNTNMIFTVESLYNLTQRDINI